MKIMEYPSFLKIFIFMMNAQLIRNTFGYKEFCIKADQNPKKRSLFMLEYQEIFFSEGEIQVSSTLGIVHNMTVPTIIHKWLTLSKYQNQLRCTEFAPQRWDLMKTH